MPTSQSCGHRPAPRRRRAGRAGGAGLWADTVERLPPPHQLPQACLGERHRQGLALLPSKETLSGAYFELRDRIDQIARQAEQQGSLRVALSGLNSIRQTLDSLTRLAGHDGPDVNVAVQANINVDVSQIVERLIRQFDNDPQTKARIAQTLLEIDNEPSA